MDWKNLERHPLNIYPNIEGKEKDELLNSIKDNGFDPRFPIVLFQDKVIDGMQRLQACIDTGIEPETTNFYGTLEDALAYIEKSNIRRSLSISQRAALAIENAEVLSKLKAEAAKVKAANSPHSPKAPRGAFDQNAANQADKVAKQLGDMYNVGTKTIERAMRVQAHAPELHEKVKKGELSLKKAESMLDVERKKVTETIAVNRLFREALDKALEEREADIKKQIMRLRNMKDNPDSVTFSLKIKLFIHD